YYGVGCAQDFGRRVGAVAARCQREFPGRRLPSGVGKLAHRRVARARLLMPSPGFAGGRSSGAAAESIDGELAVLHRGPALHPTCPAKCRGVHVSCWTLESPPLAELPSTVGDASCTSPRPHPITRSKLIGTIDRLRLSFVMPPAICPVSWSPSCHERSL